MPGRGNSHSMLPEHKLLPLLSNVVEDGDGKWKACCPIHEADGGSHDPSLKITKGADGKLLLYCFPCGEHIKAAQFCHAVGLTMSDLYPDHGPGGVRSQKGGKGKVGKRIAEFIYRDAQGAIAYRVERFEPKDFRQSRPNGEGGWIYSVKGTQLLPYRLPELIAVPATETVFIVEGEKKAEALRAWGLTATCNAGGAKKWQKSFSERFLKGRKVVVLPDNDPINPENGESKGWEHAKDVLEKSKPFAETVRILELPGLPPKGDIIDWIDQGGTLPQLMELVAATMAGVETEQVIEKPAATTPATQLGPLDVRVPDSLNDVGNGRRLVKKHGKDIRFCYPWAKWIVWDGKRWKIDDTGEVYRRAKCVADELWVEYRAVSGDVSEEYAKKILGFAKYSGGATALAKMLSCASSEPDAQILPSQLDSDRWLLNVDNGTIDLRTGEIREHNQSDLLTKLASTKFDPDATCPSWEKFLQDVFAADELVSYTQRLCGYWSTGIIREQMLPVLWGNGSNGKTTFLEAVMNTIGADYSMKAPADFLMVKRNDAHPTDKADLFGKRMVICAETDDGKRLAESMVKELTGDEKIRARRMREDFWEFDPTHKILLVTNHKPVIRGTDHGIWRRIRLIPFLRQFWNPDTDETGPAELRQDKTLKDRLESERSGILSWIVRGCLEWLHDGELQPEAVKLQTKEYRSSQDVLGAFIDQSCELGSVELFYVETAKLYAAYRKWSELNGEYAVTQRQFGLSMTERQFERRKSNGWWYMGIRLNSEIPD